MADTPYAPGGSAVTNGIPADLRAAAAAKQAAATKSTPYNVANPGGTYGPGTDAGDAARNAGYAYGGPGQNEKYVPLDLAGLNALLSGGSSNDGSAAGRAAAAAVAGQLRGTIGALQSQAHQGDAQLNSLYSQLASQLGGYIPSEDAAYQGTIGQVGNIYNQLRGEIGGNYNSSMGQIDAELQRLGEGQAVGNNDAALTKDRNFLQSLASIQDSGALSNLNFLKAGAHNYNQDVTGMAKTEGANQRAQLVQNLQAEIQKAIAANEASQKSAYSSASKSARTSGAKPPKDIMSILEALGGQWGTQGAKALNNYLGSDLAKTGKYQTQEGTRQIADGQNPDGTTKYKTVPNMVSANVNTAKIAEQLQHYLEQGFTNPQNLSTADALAQLIAHIYSGNSHYAGL